MDADGHDRPPRRQDATRRKGNSTIGLPLWQYDAATGAWTDTSVTRTVTGDW